SNLQDIFGVGAVVALRLRDHAVGAAEQVEVVHVSRSEIDLQGGEHVRNVDAEQLRLDAIDVEIELRGGVLEQGKDLRKPRRLRRPPHHRIYRVLQGLRAAPGAILDHHAETTGVAYARHWWRRGNKDQSVLDRLQAHEQLALDGGGGLLRILCTLLKRSERDEDCARIRRVGEGGAGKAHDVHRMRDTWHLERDLHRAPVDVVGARQRCGGRQLGDDDEIAAVELRDEADRRLAEFIEAEGDDAGVDHQHQHGEPDGAYR